jgi:pimeloyl-[acyl-carrier protein] synthase
MTAAAKRLAPEDMDPQARGLLVDPFPLYQRWLAVGEVLWEARRGMWIVVGHAASRAVLRSPAFAVTAARENLTELGRRAKRDYSAMAKVMGTVPFFVNPPEHAALRRFVAGILTAQAISAWVPAMREIAQELLAPLRTARAFDAAAEFADQLPPLFMARLLGLPAEDMPRLVGHTSGIIAVFNRGMRLREYDALEPKTAAALDYVGGVVAARRASPRDDAISRMLASQYDGRALDEAHVARLALMLFLVGVETTSTVIGSTIRLLVTNPGPYAELRRDPALVKSAVEEALRCEAPVQTATRLVVEPCEIDGQHFTPGERAVLFLGAASRDPRAYAEPDRFDPRRKGPANLSFGDGPHACLGATLARIEAQVALEAILELPELRRSANPETWWPYDWMRRIRSLPVEAA